MPNDGYASSLPQHLDRYGRALYYEGEQPFRGRDAFDMNIVTVPKPAPSEAFVPKGSNKQVYRPPAPNKQNNIVKTPTLYKDVRFVDLNKPQAGVSYKRYSDIIGSYNKQMDAYKQALAAGQTIQKPQLPPVAQSIEHPNRGFTNQRHPLYGVDYGADVMPRGYTPWTDLDIPFRRTPAQIKEAYILAGNVRYGSPGDYAWEDTHYAVADEHHPVGTRGWFNVEGEDKPRWVEFVEEVKAPKPTKHTTAATPSTPTPSVDIPQEVLPEISLPHRAEPPKIDLREPMVKIRKIIDDRYSYMDLRKSARRFMENNRPDYKETQSHKELRKNIKKEANRIRKRLLASVNTSSYYDDVF